MIGNIPNGLELSEKTVVRYHGNATKLVLPEGVEAIAHDAFSKCISLREVTIPASVKRIGHRAFAQCIGLSTVRFLFTDVINIDWSIFFKCANYVKVISAGDAATFEKNFGARYDPPEYDMMYGERCVGHWHYPLGHQNGEQFTCEAYCEKDGVTLKLQGHKVDFLGLYEI